MPIQPAGAPAPADAAVDILNLDTARTVASLLRNLFCDMRCEIVDRQRNTMLECIDVPNLFLNTEPGVVEIACARGRSFAIRTPGGPLRIRLDGDSDRPEVKFFRGPHMVFEMRVLRPAQPSDFTA